MNRFQRLAIGFTIIAASLASAVAAPSATRHSKLLSIKQRVMIDTGESRTSASLVSPTAHSSRSGLVALTNAFAAVPLPQAEVSKFHAALIPRFNYENFWVTMAALQACEDQLAANSATYASNQTASVGGQDGNAYMWYIYQQEPTSAKTFANIRMANYPRTAGLPAEYTGGSLAACNNNGNPAAYLAAATVREGVSNYAVDSPEVLDYVTSQFWIKASNRAAPLKAAVVQYLRKNEIEFAWVDVEFEYNHTTAPPANRRVSLSFQIGRADEPTTRGSYLGSQLVLAPEVTPADASASVRSNHIDIKYTAYTQYPDFTVGNVQNNLYLRSLMTASGFNPNGMMSWKVTQKGASTISDKLCSNITNCTPAAGEFITTSGAYDPDFMRSGDGSGPYTLEHPVPLDDISGIKCLITGKGSQRCRVDKHNVSTLMQYSNAITGTLDYIGRWEAALQSHPPRIEETGRNGIFDVCYGVEFQNSVAVSYWVRRPHWKLNLNWQQGGIDFQIMEQQYEFENIGQLPNPVNYTTWAEGVIGNNLIGSFASSNVRDNSSVASTPENTAATNYAAVNLGGYDPQTFGLPEREGAIILNPLVTRLAPNGMFYNALPDNWLFYRPIGALTTEETLAPNMITRPGQPIYKKAGLGASKALPRRWLARGNNPVVRKTDFQCVDQNEPRVDSLIMASMGIPASTYAWNTPPQDPIIPIGTTPYAGTVNAHKMGTRPDSTVAGEVGSGLTSDPCQISYVPWSSVDYTIVTTGPMPDPRFVPPASCNFSGTPATPGGPVPVPGPECFAPVNYYTKHVQINRAQDLVYISPALFGGPQPACNETCELGGTIKLCPRPWSRFN